MAESIQFIEAVPIGSVFLNNENPRFEPVESEPEAIEELCSKENILPLAADIAKIGMNPLERFALLPSGPARGKKKSYVVAEGNRRLCAIKLLNDPELAPARFKKGFRELSKDWTPVKTIPAVVFQTDEDVRIWLQRIHYGEQGGIGRKSWKADQQERFAGGGRNRLALDILDYAQARGFITESERAGKLTTVQRFLSNEIFREALGLDRADPDDLRRTRPAAEFEVLLKQFITDLVTGRAVSSRMNKPEIVEYARKLSAHKSATSRRVPATPLQPGGRRGRQTKKPTRPQRPARPPAITHSVEIETALKKLGVYKLESLYHSLVSLELETHTPLLAVGTWSFIETLTACMGRKDGNDFVSYLSKSKLSQLGFQTNDAKTIAGVIKRIQDHGNHTKHHAKAATFDSQQLHNDMETIETLIVRCAEEAIKNKS